MEKLCRTQKCLEMQAIMNIRSKIEKKLGLKLSENLCGYGRERPDFIFDNKSESLGIEVVECHPSVQKNKKRNRARYMGLQRKVCQIVLDSEVLKEITKEQKLNIFINRYRIYDCKDGKKHVTLTPQKIADELINILYTWHKTMCLYYTEHIKSIRISVSRGKNIVQFNNISGRHPIKWENIEYSIEEKNGKFNEYEREHKCDEYWLCVFIPFEESCLSNEIDYGSVTECHVQSVLNSSPFSHIYLTSVMPNDIKELK